MSLKGVELQIAIPKTFDAGKMSDQAHQQVLANQAHANEALKREVERKQTAVNMSERTDEIDGDEESTSGQSSQSKQGGKKDTDNSEQKKAHHPFKGNFVDFSG